MELKRLGYDFSVCKIDDLSGVDFLDTFCFVGKTDEEISLVCKTESVPKNTIAREDGWRAFRIQGVLDFSLVGVLSKISGICAELGIGIFAVSTYNTDYVFTKAENFEKAMMALSEAGYTIV